MKRGLMTALALASAFPAMAQGGQPVAESPIVIGRSITIPSSVLGQPRRLNVYVPPSYVAGGRRYPVLYVLDGGAEQDFHHISGLAQLASVNGATQDLIVVGVETQDRRRELAFPAAEPRYRQEWPTHGRSADFRRYLQQEVIPFVEKGWRTSGESALMGESLAGLFVVETLLRQPGLFDRYIAISPSLWWDGGALTREAPALLARHDATPRTLWLTMADEGGTMETATNRLVAALKANAPPNLRWTYAPRPGETHATIYHPAALDAIRTFYSVPPETGGPCPWWLCEPVGTAQDTAKR